MNLSTNIAIEFKDVFERYDVEILLDGKSTRESFEALKNISFSIRKGESVAIIGPNGAGKSTLLRLIAGLLAPEKGEVKVHGRVGSLLDLGAGFHPELTGRDNLLLNASLYHFSREELDKKYEEILKFAGIGKFINAPVRCYSQGMYVRLAFSLAIHVDPDIVLIDDCLAVGDDNFRLKSIDKVLELKTKHKTIVLVTHDLDLAKQICSRGIYLRDSQIIQDGALLEVASCYLKPLQVDKQLYQYLSAKILEEEKRLKAEEKCRVAEETRRRMQEEERRRIEEKKRLKTEEERCLAEEKRWKAAEERWKLEKERLVKAEEERWKLEKERLVKAEEERQRLEAEERQRLEAEERQRVEAEERQRVEAEERQKIEEEKIRLEKEKRKQGCVLFCGPSLKLIISPVKVQIIHNNRELTSHYGVRSHFMIGEENFSSDGAIWRVKKISDREILCCLRWTKPKVLFQAWYFKSLGDGTVDFEIMMRTRETLSTENERVDYCLCTPCESFGKDRLSNKSTIFFCNQEPDFKIETLRVNQICGIAMEGKDCFRAYFLTVPERSSRKEARQKHTYFKGRFSSGVKAVVTDGHKLASCKLEAGRTKIEFYEGSCQLIWGGKHLTTGLGIYTSLYSKGIWYDSTQARWKIKASSQNQLVVEGFWPWIPVAQVWEILLKDEKTVLLNAKMKVLQEIPINMQETVIMLSAEYKKWSAGKEIKEFPEGFTNDDFFRFCFWASKADGISSLSSHSDHLPTVTFKPAFMQGYRVIVENAAHICDVQSRLFHCLRVNKKEETYFASGEYDFFKGRINIKEEQV